MSIVTVTILDDDDFAGQLGTAVGWGTTGFVNGVMTAASSILREVEYPIISNSECKLIADSYNFPVKPEHLCADDSVKGTCPVSSTNSSSIKELFSMN